MRDIKIKKEKKDIRLLDKSANLSAKMKNGLARTKDQAKNLSDDGQASPSEYVEDNIRYNAENAAYDTVYAAKSAAKKSYNGTKNLIRDIRHKRQSAENIKQTAKSTGKATTKTVQKSIKTAGQTVKTSERTARTAIKTSRQAAKTTEQTVKATKKAAEAAAKAAKATAKAAAQTAKAAVKATAAAVKAAIVGVKTLAAAIAAGGSVAVIIIIVICFIALIAGSCFGVFFSGDDTGTGMTMSTAISNISTEYTAKIDEVKASASYDKLEIRGGKAAWSDVLAVYAVKTANDPNNPTEVASMDNFKYEALKNIFWDMHTVSGNTASKTETVITETRDDNGNIIESETSVTRMYLYITVTHKTAYEMAAQYGFTDDQRARLSELLSEENKKLWSGVLCGYTAGSEDIVSVALSQIGNIGSEPYWRWYGFNDRVEWCSCFVSYV